MNSSKIGDIVPLDGDIYIVKRIENGWVYLRQPNARGKERKLYWREVPYFDEGKLIIPPKIENNKPSFNSKLHLGSLFKKQTDMQVSKEFIAFAYENIETIILSLLDLAIGNAEVREDKRLVPAHWYWLEMPPHIQNGYWPSQNDYALKESLFLKTDRSNKDD
tara:strand:- start:6400 stop:6888 length:489 start_codon:yes stop_codon:yes gene_type:complete